MADFFETITNHATRALEALPGVHRKAKNLQAVVEILANEVQEVENAIAGAIMARRLIMSSGIELDVWGKILGESRDGLKDELYRRILRSRMFANRLAAGVESDDTRIDQFRQLFGVLMGSDSVRLFDHFPRGCRLEADVSERHSDQYLNRVRRMMLDAYTNGCVLSLVESFESNFTLSDDDLGFGSTLARAF